MSEKAKTTWKAIGAVVTIIIAAIGAYAALVSTGVIDNPRAAKTETTVESTIAETTAGSTVTQTSTTLTDTTKDVERQLAVGDITHFGQYDWHVLDVQGGRALLLSEDIIEQRPYNTWHTDVTWEDCTLRAYLNGEFYGKFSKAERARITLTRNENPDNTWGRTQDKQFNTTGGNPTDDHIFILSVEDVLQYFPGLRLLKNSDGNEWSFEVDERLAAKFNGYEIWWCLRSPGGGQFNAAYVNDDGEVRLTGMSVDAWGGVRPALWLNLS